VLRNHIVCNVCHRDLTAVTGLPEDSLRRSILTVRLADEYQEVHACEDCWTKPIQVLARSVRALERESEARMRNGMVNPMPCRPPTP
jgi:hypothetical protein